MAGKDVARTSQADCSGHILLKGQKIPILPLETSPCTVACPLGTNVKSYVSLIAAGRFAEALDVVRETNPFAGICGRVCPHPCEPACRRSDIDEPVAIAALKRFLADYELQRGVIPQFRRRASRPETVAVIGAGPAGLTCASDCARAGFCVTVFEALPVAGGMLANGIPAYRLPRDILNVEINAILALGIEMQYNTRVGDQISLDEIIDRYDAVCIAAGAQKPALMGVAGEREVTRGIVNWVDLLREAASGTAGKPGTRVCVVGGGNTAVDSARTALRLGAEKVVILYRRGREHMPAFAEEINDAVDEGVEIHDLCAPVRLIHRNGRLTGIECTRTKPGESDAGGRPRPVPVDNSNFVVPCDACIPAVGQVLDESFLSGKKPSLLMRNRLLGVDSATMATGLDRVFACGDAVSGASSVIEAIAGGHRAALSIRLRLDNLPLSETSIELQADEQTVPAGDIPGNRRVEYGRLDAAGRRRNFEEVNQPYTEPQARQEARRCLRCGPCLECTLCVGVCEKKQAVIEPGNSTAVSRITKRPRLVRINAGLHAEAYEMKNLPADMGGEAVTLYPFIAEVDPYFCRGCGACEETCGFHAIRVVYTKEGAWTASVDASMCRGCGTCLSVCPAQAIDQGYFTYEAVGEQAAACRGANGAGKVRFACYWKSKDGEKQTVPEEQVTLMCSGRLGAGDILGELEKGAGEVSVIGCGRDTCRYGFGREVADGNFSRLRLVMDLLGIDSGRFRVT
jgi:NADPH-dependent glutamate synthase beta subunit-like oxidoreductase/Pyruvate/2-oxoacid:ferredoxin oxidoreductase delta subunit